MKRTIPHAALLQDKARLREGSSVPTAKKTLIEQMEGVLDEGASGVILFQYPSTSDGDIEAVRPLR